MRESIGGTLLFWIVLFFMTIFIAFLAAVIQYSKVYKIKNNMLNFLEQKEGIGSDIDVFERELIKNGYPSNGKYVICRYHASDRGGYYYLKLYATFTITTFSFDVTIKGETRLVETGTLIKSNGLFDNTAGEVSCHGRGVRDTEVKRD